LVNEFEKKYSNCSTTIQKPAVTYPVQLYPTQKLLVIS
jgi:hypothetical protein